ncbi:merozoite surface protein, putative [Babesia ovata]|uniref:Merozoite surface protein, putative n=1 Tax=Babesia ovata TaxID=189622 RepID=A0A2H6K9C4_9APIC|nr:merozoite surface protein, putative [Babesia ovata]GBE59578.1 merozoite surface protein, putative [Babesia ovata]
MPETIHEITDDTTNEATDETKDDTTDETKDDTTDDTEDHNADETTAGTTDGNTDRMAISFTIHIVFHIRISFSNCNAYSSRSVIIRTPPYARGYSPHDP